MIVCLCFSLWNQTGVAVINSNENAEVSADLVDSSLYDIAYDVRRIGFQEMVNLHRCAETVALVDVEGNQNLITWMEAAGLLFKRKKQIFFQTPVQKCSDLSGSSYV